MGLAVGNTGPAIRVGFLGLSYQDGSLGLRFADNVTAFPAGITVGATWNKGLMYKRGKAHGMEALPKGDNVLLGLALGPLAECQQVAEIGKVCDFGVTPFLLQHTSRVLREYSALMNTPLD